MMPNRIFFLDNKGSQLILFVFMTTLIVLMVISVPLSHYNIISAQAQIGVTPDSNNSNNNKTSLSPGINVNKIANATNLANQGAVAFTGKSKIHNLPRSAMTAVPPPSTNPAPLTANPDFIKSEKVKAKLGINKTSSTTAVERFPKLTLTPNTTRTTASLLNTTNALTPSTTSSANTSALNSNMVAANTTRSNTIFGFEGINRNMGGGGSPSDTALAASQNRIIEMVNLRGEIFTKSGNMISLFSLRQLFNINKNNFISDPKVLFDSSTGRWFATLMDEDSQSVHLAVSTTNDPTTTTWNTYNFAFLNCPDQPTIGLSNDKVAISVNTYTDNCNGDFSGVQYTTVDKNDVIAGATSPKFTQSQLDASQFSLHPVQSFSPTSTLFMVSLNPNGGNTVRLVALDGTAPDVRVTTDEHIRLLAMHVPPVATQPGTSVSVDTGDARVQDAIWRQGKLWLTANNGCSQSRSTETHSCIRLTELDTNSKTVNQDFDITGPSIDYYYPSIRIDTSGNLVVVSMLSSDRIFQSMMAVGKPIEDSVGQPIILRSGTMSDPNSNANCGTPDTPIPCVRAGDYSAAANDPSTPSTVWIATMYLPSSSWSTYVDQVNASSLR